MIDLFPPPIPDRAVLVSLAQDLADGLARSGTDMLTGSNGSCAS
jgi:hypothetical protein